MDHHRSNTVDKVHTVFDRVINREEGLAAAKISRGATPESRAETKQLISLKKLILAHQNRRDWPKLASASDAGFCRHHNTLKQLALCPNLALAWTMP